MCHKISHNLHLLLNLKCFLGDSFLRKTFLYYSIAEPVE